MTFGNGMASDISVASPGAYANDSKMSQNTTIKKRERRPNYTLEEKALLADLVTQYHHIVEDKRTGGIFYRRKREAWKVITIKYNSKARTGPRETENLKILYDNMKQQAKKNDGDCLTNTTLKIRLFELFQKDYNQNKTDTVAEEDAVKALQSMRQEKLNEHGGNFYKPKPDDPDGVEPLSNPYDSAAAYFRDNVHHQPALDPIQFLDLSLPDGQTDAKFDSVNNTSEHNSWGSQPSTSCTASPEPNTIKIVPKQSKQPLSLVALKRLYFKRKCQNANLERKKILQEISFAQQKHSLEMIILRRTLDKQ